MGVAWQDSLFAPEGEAGVGAAGSGGGAALSFDGVRRQHLDERCWLDYGPHWLPDQAALLDLLLAEAPWQQRTRWMYEGPVLEPRMVASWAGDGLAALPDRLEEIRSAMSNRYRVVFDSVLVNLYRDGRDGVAWHGDTVRHQLPAAVVVTVALGERRRFLLRPGTSGPATRVLHTGEGDLLVMGGRTQHEWQHTVPKAARAGARMSVTMRHSAALPA